MSFSFVGVLPASKSLLNRAFIVKSYFSDFEVSGESSCEDIQVMKKAVRPFFKGVLPSSPIFCGDSGTGLRFLALRLSRVKGEHQLVGSSQLMRRLPQALLSLLNQLGCEAKIEGNCLSIKTEGWRLQGDGVYVPTSDSSQFASSLLLNSWQLNDKLHFSLERSVTSQKYFLMTKQLLKSWGLQWVENGREFTVAPHQSLKAETFHAETDLSSSFCVGVIAALFGEAYILNFPNRSLQPDFCFLEILSQIGAKVTQEKKGLRILKAESIKPLSMSLQDCPDLFPCLSVLLAFAKGDSLLEGLSCLKNKESNRILKIYELLKKCNVDVEKTDSSFKITGGVARAIKPFNYHADGDHRIAMAAGILKKHGVPIHIEDPESINKSFPNFWKILSMGDQGD